MISFRLPPRRSARNSAGALIVALIALPFAAHAQLGADTLSSVSARGRTVAPLPQRPAPPPALPGTQAGVPAVQSQRVPLDMQPTEALFDAVNRGDIEAVRDALARGAELSSRNILGITATELAIDLGRNDIAFLLLSMRAADRPRSGRGPQGTSPGAGQAAAIGQTQRLPRATPQPRAMPARAEAAPRSYPNDPGTPVPDAGFLGFDDRASTRYR